MADLFITVLGSSAGMPQADRINAGYVLAVNGRLIQFDCGGGISMAFRRAGFDPLAVDKIFISHMHPDHVSDLPLYIQLLYLAGRQEAIDIHLPPEAVEPTRDYFRALYLLPEKLPFPVNFIPILANEKIISELLSIQPIANSHLSGYAPFIKEFDLANRMQCFSFLIRVGDKSILYSSDLGSEDDIFPYLKNLNLLIVESTHIDVARVVSRAVDDGTGKIVLTHIAEHYDTGQAVMTAHKIGFPGLVIAHDGLKIAL